jgi:hypothetical protein
MNELSQIKQSLKNITGNAGNAMFVAQVKQVSQEICTVEVDGTPLTYVRLRAVIDGAKSKIVISPKKDSLVLVTDLSGGQMTDLAAIVYSAIDRIDIDGDVTITLNGGDNGGLVKSQTVADKISRLEERCKLHIHSRKLLLTTNYEKI